MAFIDLELFGKDPEHAVMGEGAAVMQSRLDGEAHYTEVIAEARRGLHIPRGELILGIAELEEYLGRTALISNPDS
jgi:hypothetical protein